MSTKSIYTKALGKAVAEGAKKDSVVRTLHVAPSYSGKWVVVPQSSVKAVRAFASQKSAIEFAKKYANAKSATEVVVYENSGGVKERIAV